MKLAKLALSKYVLGTLVILALLIGFNASRARLESELLAQFNEWYTEVSPKLYTTDDSSPTLSTLNVTIQLSGPDYPSLTSWTFPPHALTDPEERAQTARVLQLVSESKVFQVHPITREVSGENYLRISVSDQTKRFETVVALKSVRDNIQLQNLLKLLQLFGNEPKATVSPTQL
jgi:hypothetical protein